MSFEDNFAIHIDNRREKREKLPTFMIEAHKRATKEVLNNPDYAIQAPEFLDLYGKENILADMQKVKELSVKFSKGETTFDKNSRITSEVFEAIVLMHSELSEWLGEAHTLKTSRYDDYINKTDLIAEWYNDGVTRQLALAVDVTFGASSIEKKLSQIKEEINRGELGIIKYHKSDFDDSRGEKRNVPRVVVGISMENVHQLAALWMQNDNVALGKHPIQRVMLKEIKDQLDSMLNYSEKMNNEKAIKAYKRSLAVINGLYTQKADIPFGSFMEDKVFQEIQMVTKGIFGN